MKIRQFSKHKVHCCIFLLCDHDVDLSSVSGANKPFIPNGVAFPKSGGHLTKLTSTAGAGHRIDRAIFSKTGAPTRAATCATCHQRGRHVNLAWDVKQTAGSLTRGEDPIFPAKQ